ncbi:MAG: lipocalin-like domain-containing protein [Burkholderiales bacterium]
MNSESRMVKQATFGSIAIALVVYSAAAICAEGEYAQVRKGVELQFPRDDGSHPQFRTEWWYITGWLRTREGGDLGMQITFFRNRPGIAETNRSEFAPRQLLFAHAALSDPQSGRMLHDQRAARAGFGLAEAREDRTDVLIDDWSLKQSGSGYAAEIVARDFRYSLQFRITQPALLQGGRGVSRKGPRPQQASFYYSRPHLQVSGTATFKGRRLEVSGDAWLDHEWSSEYLAAEAGGWDWVGVNLADGGALMAFRIRDRQGGTYWAGGAHRGADGRVRILRPEEVRFTALRRWRSPRTQVEYPVAMRVAAGGLALELDPLMDDQEFDSRASTGTIYWEGAVRATQAGKLIGRGYLELTGYWKPLKL